MTRINKKNFKKACDKSGGVIQVVADRLEVTRDAIYKYLERNPEEKQTLEKARDQLIDAAEQKLMEHIESGDPWATQFTLKTLGKNRGYTERTETEHEFKGENTLKVEFVNPENSKEEKEE